MTPLFLVRDRLPAGVARHIAGWADQAVVSATSFIALIVIARSTDASGVGLFALGNSILALLLATQESLVTRPYAIRVYDPLGPPAEYAAFSLRLSAGLGLAGAILLAAVALTYPPVRNHEQLPAILMLAAIVPFVLLREFARRYSFAHMNMIQALRLDAIVSVLTVIGLGVLGWTGSLSVASAFGAVGFACAIGVITWCYRSLQEFSFAIGPSRSRLHATWAQGKWFLASQMAIQIQAYSVYWLSLVMLGAAVTGVYAACMSVVALANPVLFGYYNGLLPKLVHKLKHGGGRELLQQALRDAAALLAVMALFCSSIILIGEQLVTVLYPGGEYAGNGRLLSVLALASGVAAVGVPASMALASAGRGRTVAAVTLVTVILNVVLTWTLMTRYGLLGAALGMLAAEFIGSVGRWTALVTMVSQIDETRQETQVHSPVHSATMIQKEAAP